MFETRVEEVEGRLGLSESDYENIVLSHYNKPDVQREIAKFSQDRWVAIHCKFVNPQGYQVLLRYQRGEGKSKTPLTITKPDDVPLLLKRFQRLRPRAFYASICVYRELTRQEHVKDFRNIAYCAPTWDIDNTPEKWKATIEAAKEITTLLSKEGVSKSVFLKWSGKGAHVHVHQRALSPTLLQKIAPLDAAYAIVEHINRALRAKLTRIAKKNNAAELNVENEIDLQRVFTCSLSLHRSMSSVAVCFPPAQVDDFTPGWTRTDSCRHWEDWDQFEIGEADALAEKAYRLVGRYPGRTLPKSKPEPKSKTSSLSKWLTSE